MLQQRRVSTKAKACNRDGNGLLSHLKFARFYDLAIRIGEVINVNAAGKFIEVKQKTLLGEGGGKDFFTQDAAINLQGQPAFKVVAQLESDVADGGVRI